MKSKRKPTRIEVAVYYITVVLGENLNRATPLKTFGGVSWENWLVENNFPPAFDSEMYGKVQSRMINLQNIRFVEFGRVLMTPNGKEKVEAYIQSLKDTPASDREKMKDVREAVKKFYNQPSESCFIP